MTIDNVQLTVKRICFVRNSGNIIKKVVCIVFMICFVCVSMTACYDAKEVYEWTYVYTIGVDKGVSDQLRFTFQIPTLKGVGCGGGGGGGQGAAESQQKMNYTTISIDCPTFYTGANMVETSLSRTLNYMHAKYIIISEDLAREGVETFINGMVRSRQIRRIMYVIIVRGKASEFVKEFNPVLTSVISKAQEGLMNQGSETGFLRDTNYHYFVKDLKTTYRMPVAALAAINDFSSYKTNGTPPKGFKSEGDYYAGELPRSGGNKYEFLGTALFDGDKMVGELNGDETRVMLMVRGEFDRGSIAIADPLNKELRITVDTSSRKSPGIKIAFHEGKPVINVKLFLEGDIQNIQSPNEYESEKLKPILENAYKVYIKNLLDKTIDKCKRLNVDVFGFGENAAMHFLTIQEWEAYNWVGKFKDAEVTTEVEFRIKRTGTLLKTNPTRNSKGVQK